MRALIIEHDPLSTPERVGTHLEASGFELRPFVVVDDLSYPEVTTTFPDHDFDVVVLMGAPWSVFESRVQGWVRPEVEFVRETMNRGTPTLGICFGAQIMATALGGEVSRAAQPEYGWRPIESEEPAISDGPWFHFHRDRIALPAGATQLARTDDSLQAFRFGVHLAVQFHPEVTAALIRSWFAVGGGRPLTDAGIDLDQVISETEERASSSQPALEQMLEWWLEGMPSAADSRDV